LGGRVDVLTEVDHADEDDAVGQASGQQNEPVQPVAEIHEQQEGEPEHGLETGYANNAQLVPPLRLFDAFQGSGAGAVRVGGFGHDSLLPRNSQLMMTVAKPRNSTTARAMRTRFRVRSPGSWVQGSFTR